MEAHQSRYRMSLVANKVTISSEWVATSLSARHFVSSLIFQLAWGCFSTCSLSRPDSGNLEVNIASVILQVEPGELAFELTIWHWKCLSKILWPLHSVAFQQSINLQSTAVQWIFSPLSTIIRRAAYCVVKIQHPSTVFTIFRVSPSFPILLLALHSCRPASPHLHAWVHWVAAMWLAT